MQFKGLLALTFALLGSTFTFAQDWEEVASIPGGNRHHPICFSLDGKGFVLCGNPDPNETEDPYLDDFYEYDPVLDQWTKKADFPGSPRGFGVGLNYNGKGYAGFGYGSGMYLNDLWEYDAETDEWTRLPDCPCLGRTHPAFLAAQGKIYVGLGGVGTNAKDWWSYDLEDQSWQQEQDFPGVARHHPYYFTVDDIPYVMFGHSRNAIHDDVYKFDPLTREWVRLQDFPSHARVAGTHFALNGKGYVVAGDDENHGYDEGEFWEYDPPTDSWIQLPTFPEDGRWAPGALVIDQTAYFIAGYARNTREYHNDMWTYSLATSTSTDDEIIKDVSIAPNPVQDVFTLQGDLEGLEGIEILDQQGRIVMSGTTETTWNVTVLPKGIYQVRLTYPETIQTLQFIR
jgi:N-acetylneuraminic acid mutarotase